MAETSRGVSTTKGKGIGAGTTNEPKIDKDYIFFDVNVCTVSGAGGIGLIWG